MTQQLKTATEFHLLSQVFEKVGGFLSPLEGYTLFLIAQHGEGNGAIVEIGSFEGKSTGWLALGSKRRGREHVTAVDTFLGSPEHQPDAEFASASIIEEGTTLNVFRRNMETLGVTEYVNPIVATSEEAASQWSGDPIRLLFIDGDHSYEACAADYHAWSKFVAESGYVLFHDYGHSEHVTRFCDELEAQQGPMKKAFYSGSICAFQRRPD